MNYTLHQLKVFLTVCEEKSVTRAAEKLHLTQPAVSIQLKRLQEQFDIPLTEIIGRQLHVTEFGNKIAETSRRVLQEANQINEQVDLYKGLLSGSIVISSVSTGKYVIPYYLQSFMNRYPKVDIEINVTNKQQVIHQLQENSCDFGLVSVIPEFMKVQRFELLTNHLFIVSRQFNDFQSVKDSPNTVWIFREVGSATRAAMERFIAKEGIVVHRSIELVSNEAVKQAVIAGIGISVLPLIGLKNELVQRDISIIPHAATPIETTWNLVHTKKALSPASQALLSHIDENKSRVFDEHFSWTKQFSS